MEHTYTLSNTGFLNPNALRSLFPCQIRVEHPRELIIADMTLQLLDGEPDLPVGSQVKVWFRRWFHCESMEFIKKKEDEIQQRKEAHQAHEDKIRKKATIAYLDSTRALVDSHPSVEKLKVCLDLLYGNQETEYATYHRFWCSSLSDNKQRSNDAFIVLEVLSEAIKVISVYVYNELNERGIKGVTAYAYSPREGGSEGFHSPGKDHFMLLVPVQAGRFKREINDALCKPARKFWGLHRADENRWVTCRSCLNRMLKLLG